MTSYRKTSLLGAVAATAAFVLGPQASQLHADYASTVLDQNPLFYWRFNDNSTNPTSEVDNSESADNNALIGDNVLIDQSDPPSLRPDGGFGGFESTNTWLNFQGTEASSLVQGLTDPLESMDSLVGTASMWFSTTVGADPGASEGNPSSIYHGDSGADGALDVAFQPDDRLQFRVTNQFDGTIVDLRSEQTYTDGEWHQVAAVWDRPGNFAALYVDGGAEAGGETITGGYSLGIGFDFIFDNRHRFGKGLFNANRFHGAADELAIWNVALTEEQIRAQYEAAVAAASVVGDADGDGDVDAFDLGIWQTQFGMTGEGLSADFDMDGDVDAFDLGLWQTNFGTGLEAAVPEPASLGILALGAAALWRRRPDR